MSTASSSVHRIPILEGLRAYLSWWVVYFHCIVDSGFDRRYFPGALKVLVNGELAVDLFVILSGFVITQLVIQKREPYRVYITRRFFRIYPVFLLIVGFGALLSTTQFAIYKEYYAQFGQPAGIVGSLQFIGSWQHYVDHPLAYLASSLTMLHGAMPNKLLPDAYAAFTIPGWSLSLEWQFYLIFPLVLACFHKRPLLTLAAVGAVIWTSPLLDIGNWGSFLPQHGQYFAIGIFSGVWFRQLVEQQTLRRYAGLATPVVLFVVLTAIPEMRMMVFDRYALTAGAWAPLALWAAVFTLIVDYHTNPKPLFVRCFAWLFLNPVAQYLGKVSYCTYLIHYFFIFLGMWLAMRYGFLHSKYAVFAVIAPVTTIGTLLASHLVHRWVELPGIALGKRLLRSRPAASQPLEKMPVA